MTVHIEYETQSLQKKSDRRDINDAGSPAWPDHGVEADQAYASNYYSIKC